MSEAVLKGVGLTRRYTTAAGEVLTACSGVDLELYGGETLGIVGESGCGKSTLLRLLTQLERPDGGRLFSHGRDITGLRGEALRQNRRHLQMVMQDPASAFFPGIRAGDAVVEPLMNFGKLSKAELINARDALFELVQLPLELAWRYPHAMSGGQRQRLGIARALAPDPEVLICDEATASLDVLAQKQIVELLVDIQKRRGLSIIFVCHDLALVQSLSHRIMVMYLGGVVETLPGNNVREEARHPYTKALLDSIFTIDADYLKEPPLLKGDVPSPLAVPVGCLFQTRCPHCTDRCRMERPALRDIAPGHKAACHLLENAKKAG